MVQQSIKLGVKAPNEGLTYVPQKKQSTTQVDDFFVELGKEPDTRSCESTTLQLYLLDLEPPR